MESEKEKVKHIIHTQYGSAATNRRECTDREKDDRGMNSNKYNYNRTGQKREKRKKNTIEQTSVNYYYA